MEHSEPLGSKSPGGAQLVQSRVSSTNPGVRTICEWGPVGLWQQSRKDSRGVRNTHITCAGGGESLQLLPGLSRAVPCSLVLQQVLWCLCWAGTAGSAVPWASFRCQNSSRWVALGLRGSRLLSACVHGSYLELPLCSTLRVCAVVFLLAVCC